ncbi:hypothetical protein TRFO_31646 [Tritrichomonas foetus]|uniref:Right handed beta helix domain-containing protein n=1 Tax=Tritrichomonas foetus TaxID=1144522 RepID=A0A1J4JVE6_9EUKA|nr:hypothetical protein TRFO_31646 [Tritrichomonas foetus]|eukprot:OHT01500.1 hypothetical protein TRFO_31646 [Tritrichomonas foetus]
MQFLFFLLFQPIFSFFYPDAPFLDSIEYETNQTEGIVAKTGSLTIMFSRFISLTSSDSGGAVQATKIETFVHSCYFEDCSSRRLGGAVYVRISGQQNIVTFTLRNSTFIENKSQYSGGALYFFHSRDEVRSIISSCVFIKNVAELTAGAIYMECKGNCYVKNSYFSQNTGYINGTTLYLSSGFLDPAETNLHYNVIKNCYFLIENSQSFQSGVCVTGNFNGRARIRDIKIETFNGIGLLMYASSEKITSIAFYGCICLQTESYKLNSTTLMEDPHVIPNCTNPDGQCINFPDDPPYDGDENDDEIGTLPTLTTATPSFIPSPTMTVDTSRDYCSKNMSNHHNYFYQYTYVVVDHTCFTQIMTQGSGGAIWIFQTPFTIKYSTFDSCYSLNYGGAVYYKLSDYEFNFSIARSNFTNCYAELNGGAVYFYSTREGKSFTFLNNRFIGNEAITGRGGGLMLVTRGNSLVENCYFSCNRAATYGASLVVICGSRTDNVYDTNPNNIQGCTFNVHTQGGNASTSSVYIGGTTNGRIMINSCVFSTSKEEFENVIHVLNDRNLLSFDSYKKSCVYGTENSVKLYHREDVQCFNFNCGDEFASCEKDFDENDIQNKLPFTISSSISEADNIINNDDRESLIAGVSLAVSLLVVIIIVFVICKQKKPRKKHHHEDNDNLQENSFV